MVVNEQVKMLSTIYVQNLRNHAKFRAVRGRSRSSTFFKVIELDRLDANRKSIICNFLVLSLHKQPFVATHFQFITAHFVHHCALKNALVQMQVLQESSGLK